MAFKCNLCQQRCYPPRGWKLTTVCPGCRRASDCRRAARIGQRHQREPVVAGHAARVERYTAIVKAGGRLFE